jgi:putative nucleotidyltransferase with HDIG domain
MTSLHHQSSLIIQDLTEKNTMPPRLLAHLTTVHHVASIILDWLEKTYPALSLDKEAVRFGAMTHDIGKVTAREEIDRPGADHEKLGYQLLLTYNVSPELARFTYTHSAWTNKTTTIEDWIVSLADKVWKGKRVIDLEELIVQHISDMVNKEKWEVFGELDDLLTLISQDADKRLAYQSKL